MKKLTNLLYIVLIITVAACSKKDSAVRPTEPVVNPPVTQGEVTVSIDSVSSVTMPNATIYTKVTGKTGSTIADRGICWSLTSTPKITDSVVKASSVNGSGAFQTSLSRLSYNTTYHVRSFVSGGGSVIYSKEITFKTASEPTPEVTTSTDFLPGATIVFVKGEYSSNSTIKESGVLISENETPSGSDRKILNTSAGRSFFMKLTELKPSTTYYFRAFATTQTGVTGYGANVKVTTTSKGNLTYNFHEDPGAPEANARIKASLEQAAYLYNNYTPVVKHLDVYYHPGIPTAEASFNGYVGVGANPSYQRTGTILHEIAHTLGVGQHWMWDQLIKNGVYQGKNAVATLRFLTRDPNINMYGDRLHVWPYGVNGAFEDTGNEMDYIINVMMISAMREDGLPSN